MAKNTDVVIIGGGLAGLTLALQLRRRIPSLGITVLERQYFPVPETTFKIGESLVEVSSWYLRETLDLGAHLLEAHLPKFGLRFFLSDGDNGDLGLRPEYGPLGGQRELHHKSIADHPLIHLTAYNVDRGRLENHLQQRCLAADVEIIDGCKVKDFTRGTPHRLIADANDSEFGLQARWVVDTTGRAGFLARRMNLRQMQRHQVNAAWFRVAGRIDPDDWTNDRAYHSRTSPNVRWLSTNHLMGQGYWVWLIPLASGATSVGVMSDPSHHSFNKLNQFEKVLTWLREREPQLAAEVSSRSSLDFHAMKVKSYVSRRSFSTERWALSGESAYFSDALYSPGGDFIAVGNTLITEMVAADVSSDRHRVGIIAGFGEALFDGMFRHYYGLYHETYSLMGNPGVMLQKVAWDTAIYFAYNVLLFTNERFCDVEFQKTIRNENAKLEILQKRMIYRFKTNKKEKASYSGCFVDQLLVAPVQTLYQSSRDRLDQNDDLKNQLRQNLETLEFFSNTIEEIA